MTPFFRIKNFLINLERLAYVHIEENYIDFGFSFPSTGVAESIIFVWKRERI